MLTGIITQDNPIDSPNIWTKIEKKNKGVTNVRINGTRIS